MQLFIFFVVVYSIQIIYCYYFLTVLKTLSCHCYIIPFFKDKNVFSLHIFFTVSSSEIQKTVFPPALEKCSNWIGLTIAPKYVSKYISWPKVVENAWLKYLVRRGENAVFWILEDKTVKKNEEMKFSNEAGVPKGWFISMTWRGRGQNSTKKGRRS